MRANFASGRWKLGTPCHSFVNVWIAAGAFITCVPKHAAKVRKVFIIATVHKTASLLLSWVKQARRFDQLKKSSGLFWRRYRYWKGFFGLKRLNPERSFKPGSDEMSLLEGWLFLLWKCKKKSGMIQNRFVANSSVNICSLQNAIASPLLKFNMTLNVSKCIISSECIFSHGIQCKFERV